MIEQFINFLVILVAFGILINTVYILFTKGLMRAIREFFTSLVMSALMLSLIVWLLLGGRSPLDYFGGMFHRLLVASCNYVHETHLPGVWDYPVRWLESGLKVTRVCGQGGGSSEAQPPSFLSYQEAIWHSINTTEGTYKVYVRYRSKSPFIAPHALNLRSMPDLVIYATDSHNHAVNLEKSYSLALLSYSADTLPSLVLREPLHVPQGFNPKRGKNYLTDAVLSIALEWKEGENPLSQVALTEGEIGKLAEIGATGAAIANALLKKSTFKRDSEVGAFVGEIVKPIATQKNKLLTNDWMKRLSNAADVLDVSSYVAEKVADAIILQTYASARGTYRLKLIKYAAQRQGFKNLVEACDNAEEKINQLDDDFLKAIDEGVRRDLIELGSKAVTVVEILNAAKVIGGFDFLTSNAGPAVFVITALVQMWKAVTGEYFQVPFAALEIGDVLLRDAKERSLQMREALESSGKALDADEIRDLQEIWRAHLYSVYFSLETASEVLQGQWLWDFADFALQALGKQGFRKDQATLKNIAKEYLNKLEVFSPPTFLPPKDVQFVIGHTKVKTN